MHGRNPQHSEEVSRDRGNLRDERRTCAAHHAFPRVVAGYPHSSELAVPSVELVEPYAGFRAIFQPHLADRDQTVRVRVRQRPPERSVGDGQHGGVDAQTEG